MCEFSLKLVAWMDGELPADEMAALDRHVDECAECRAESERFRAASQAFAECVQSAPWPNRFNRRWLVVPAAIAAGLAVAFLLPLRAHRERQPIAATSKAEPVEIAQTVESRRTIPAIATKYRKRPVRPVQVQTPWTPVEPTVEVMIPADAIFPPGALPEGVDFVADLRLATNGSSASLALRP